MFQNALFTTLVDRGPATTRGSAYTATGGFRPVMAGFSLGQLAVAAAARTPDLPVPARQNLTDSPIVLMRSY